MPTIHPVTQGDAEWLALRVGKVTASEVSNLVTPEFKVKTGETPHTYVCQKVAEAWHGSPIAGFTSWAMEQGRLLEDRARAWYALAWDDVTIRNVGFITGDDGRCGCSPDALLGEDGGLELKAPQCTNQVRYFLAGTLPKEYAAQVHFSMYVTGRPWWRFVSYHRGYPALVVRVERDNKIMTAIQEALEQFYERFDAAMAKLESAV